MKYKCYDCGKMIEIEAECSCGQTGSNSALSDGVILPTAFPRGTVVHYNGIPCELLDDTPYYSATIESKKIA